MGRAPPKKRLNRTRRFRCSKRVGAREEPPRRFTENSAFAAHEFPLRMPEQELLPQIPLGVRLPASSTDTHGVVEGVERTSQSYVYVGARPLSAQQLAHTGLSPAPLTRLRGH